MHIFPLKKVSFSFTRPRDTTPSVLPRFTRGNTYSVDSTNAMVRYYLALYIYPFCRTTSSCLSIHRVEPVQFISLFFSNAGEMLSLFFSDAGEISTRRLRFKDHRRYHHSIPVALAVQRPCLTRQAKFLFFSYNRSPS